MLGELIILDSDKKICARLTPSLYFDYSYHAYLETGAETFDFSVTLDEELEQVITERNFVLFIRNNKYKMFQIMACEDEENIDSVVRNVQSEIVGLELRNDYIRESTITGNMNKFLDTILKDTNYKKGYVSPELDDISVETSITEPKAVYTVIQESIARYGNCEYEFTVNPIDSINGNYELIVNCYADGERGNKTYKRYDYDFNSYGMKRTGDATDLASGLIGVGANGITFKDIKWEKDQGDPLDKPLGQDFLLDPDAHDMFSNGDKYILGKYTSDTTDPGALLLETYKKLQEVKQIKYSYEIPVYLTDDEYDEIEVGDTNYIVNDKFNPPIQLEGRISELELTDSENKITLANFKNVKSNIKSLKKEDIINETIDIIKKTGKLTASDILAIRQYLQQLGVDKKTIDNLIKKYIDKVLPDPVDPGDDKSKINEDTEDYRAIKISKIDNGLWLGDDRIRDCITHKCGEITKKKPSTDPTPVPPKEDNSKLAKQYKAAVNYYAKFTLGTKSDTTGMKNLKSKSNPWKIYIMVEHYAKKFGLDKQLVYAVIYAESTASPYKATKDPTGGYGLMQCERGTYFNKKQTIVFKDGSKDYFTPTYNNMRPKSCGSRTISGVKVDKAVANQIMFGCNELRKALVYCRYNVFAGLCMYNMGIGSFWWIVMHYIKDKYGMSIYVHNNGKSAFLNKQSAAVQKKFWEVLENMQAPWAKYRAKYKAKTGWGTSTNIEWYLRWYKVVDGQLPYTLDAKGNKKGYGAVKPASANKSAEATAVATESLSTNGIVTFATSVSKAPTWSISGNTTTKKGVAENVRKKIVSKAKEIAELHQKYKKATYNGSYAIYNDAKRFRAPGTIKGIYKPYCYVCSSLSSCAYRYAGLRSITNYTGYYGTNCNNGALIKQATKYSGYVMKKLTSTTINELLPGDVIMLSNGTVPSNVTVAWASAPNGAYRKDKGTHHVVVYCGKVNGKRMIAHASGPYYWPRAIRYEDMSITYSSRGSMTHWYTHGIILRPWDLARADKEAKLKNQKDTNKTPPKDIVDDPNEVTYEVTFKGLDESSPGDFVSSGNLVTNVTVNNITDKTAYPKTVSHVLLSFGINSLGEDIVEDYKSLIKALLKKYPKKPIFVCQECHVPSSYNNYKTVNEEVDAFNKLMEDYCNTTKYVIFLKKPAGLCDSSDKQLWLSSLTSDGWTMKDKTSTQTYYKEYKKKILYYGTGGNWSDDSTTVNKFLDSEKIYTYTKPMKKIQFRVPAVTASTYNDSYYARLIFTTQKDKNPTKYIQPDTVYLEGVDCKKGVLIPKGDTTYSISIYYNPDTTISNKPYLGSVAAKRKGGNYAAQPLFRYRSDLVKIAKSYYSNNNKFTYNGTTPADFKNPADNISKWKTNGKYQIDDSCFLNYVLTGWTYDKSPYGNEKKTNNNRNNNISWALPSVRNEANIGKYFVQQNWVVDGADLQTYTNLSEGDIIFMDADGINNGEFMGISHTAIVTGKDSNGDYEALECTNGLSSGVFRYVKVKNLASKNILFIGRFRIG